MDSAEALVEAAIHGVGIVHLPTYLLASAIRGGQLTPILERFAPRGSPIRAIYPTRRQVAPKVRMFIDSLTAAWQPLPPWERELAGSLRTSP